MSAYPDSDSRTDENASPSGQQILRCLLDTLNRAGTRLRAASKPQPLNRDTESDFEVEMDRSTASHQSDALHDALDALEAMKEPLRESSFHVEDEQLFDEIIRTVFRLALHRDGRLRLRVAEFGLLVS